MILIVQTFGQNVVNKYYFGVASILYVKRKSDIIEIHFKNSSEILYFDYGSADNETRRQLILLLNRIERYR